MSKGVIPLNRKPGRGLEHKGSCHKHLPLCLHLDLSGQHWEPSYSYPGDWGFLSLKQTSVTVTLKLQFCFFMLLF